MRVERDELGREPEHANHEPCARQLNAGRAGTG
jgi:hypothetical protein